MGPTLTFVLAVCTLQVPTVASLERVEMVIENRGRVLIDLYPNKAPKTVARVSELIRQGFYDGTRFHRVETNPRPFIVAGGDPLTKTKPVTDPSVGTGGTGKKLLFEKNDLKFTDGTLGMSRDLADPNSADCQFFICLGSQRFLEGTYTAFARVASGMDVVRKIEVGDKITRMRFVR